MEGQLSVVARVAPLAKCSTCAPPTSFVSTGQQVLAGSRTQSAFV